MTPQQKADKLAEMWNMLTGMPLYDMVIQDAKEIGAQLSTLYVRHKVKPTITLKPIYTDKGTIRPQKLNGNFK